MNLVYNITFTDSHGLLTYRDWPFLPSCGDVVIIEGKRYNVISREISDFVTALGIPQVMHCNATLIVVEVG